MIKGGLITLLIQAFRMSLQFLILILMSRSLELDDIGNFTIAVVVISFVELLRDFGLRLGTLEKKNLSQQESSNIFWISTFWGVFSFLTLSLLLQVFIIFVGATEVVEILQILSFTLIFSGLQAQFGVEMARRGRLITLGLTDFFAQLFAGIVGVYLVISSYGEISLYIQFICASAFLTLFRIAQSDWFPNRPRKTNSLKDLLHVSGNLGRVQVLNWAGNNIDTLILGLTMPSSSVSIYNRAYGLTLTPQQGLLDSLTNWIIPVSKADQDKSDAKEVFYVMSHKFVSFAFIPAIFFFIIFSENIVQITLGAKWAQVSDIFQILSLAMIPNIYINLLRWMYIVERRTETLLKTTMYCKIITVIFLIIGGLVSISALASALVLSNVLTWLFLSSMMTRGKVTSKVQSRRKETFFFGIGVVLFVLF
jgi:O-antigen/teichoic acid export membrane protein